MRLLSFVLAILFWAVVSIAEAAHIDVTNVDVDEAKIDKVVQTIRDVDDYIHANFDGRGLRMDVRVVVATEASKIPRMFSMSELGSDRVGARSRMGIVQVIADPNKSDERLCFLTAHELIHQYQASAIGGMEFLGKNMWLTEGMADVLALKIVGDYGMQERFLQNTMRYAGENLSLKNITQKQGWNNAFNRGLHPYAIADRVVWYLVNNYPEENLFTMLDLLSYYSASDSLAAVYGLSLEELSEEAGIPVESVEPVQSKETSVPKPATPANPITPSTSGRSRSISDIEDELLR